MKKLFSVRTIILAGSLLLQLSTLCFHSRGAAGDVDLSFDPGSGVNGPVNAIAVQPDGKVIIGGAFTTVKGLARSCIARLNADGSGDATFNAGPGVCASDIALQPDGKIVASCGSAVRLNSDGTLDSSFVAATPSYQYGGGFTCLAIQPDGKVLLGGYFIEYYVDGEGFIYYYQRSQLVRLNANGTADTNFAYADGVLGDEAYETFIETVTLQPDGKILIGGAFIGNGWNQNGIVRLNANGSLDGSFNLGLGISGSDGRVLSVALQSDGKVVIGGTFNSVNGTNRNGIARLNANGSLDGSFNPSTEPLGGYFSHRVESVAVQSDGKVLIGGYFTTVNGTNRNGIARLNANGTLDNSFDPGAAVQRDFGYPGGIRSFVVQSNGKVLIGGWFSTVNGTNRERMARLNADGTLDNSFYPGAAGAVQNAVSSLVVQPDGKVLIGGPLTFINGTNHYGSARLNADGSLDSTFISNSFNPDLPNLGSTTNEYDSTAATAIAVQPDGKLLVGGASTHFYDCDPFGGGCSVYTIYFVTRLNPNGSRDTNFAGAGAVGYVSSIAVQSDGKVIIGSDAFVAVKIIRLNADGSLDSGFNPGTGPNGSVSSVVSQPDGKVLIGGYFTAVNGVNRTNIARLNADGSLDSSFNPGTGTEGTDADNRASVRSIALQSDGKVLIGGDFTTVNGVVRPHVARLYGDSGAPSLSITRSNASVIVSWPVTGLNFQLQETTNLALPNSWSSVAHAAVTNAGQISVAVPATAGRKFFRLSSP